MSEEINKNLRVVNRKELLSALSSISAGLADKESVEQSTCFIFDTNRIYTYNDNIGAVVAFDIGLHCAVPSGMFMTLLRKLKKDDITLSLNEGTLTVQAGSRVTANLTVFADVKLSYEEYVKPPAKMQKFKIGSEEFANGVKTVEFTVCEDMQRMQLCGVHIGSDSVGTFIESTDRSRITRKYVSDANDAIDMKLPILAAKALSNLSPTDWALADGWLHFKCKGGVQFVCWVPAEAYPDLSKFLTTVEAEKCTTVTFPEAIERMLDISNDFAVDKIAKDGRVTITVKDGKARLFVKGDYGAFKESCKVKASGEAKFRTHPQKLLQIFQMSLTIKIGESTIIVKGTENKLPFWHISQLDVLDTEE